MTAECYLVVRKTGKQKRATVVRVTQRKPSLVGNEACIKLQLELPDDVFETPLFTVPVERRHVQVAVEPEEVT